ncbi:UDP-N-acetylmuramate--L-alanine ligase [bacterium]|nr:UDP-N-acetylmuramate--L-alanine ligase [bacterium]
MSALARYFNSLGASVYGYDRTESSITEALQNEGISIGFIDEVEQIPQEVLASKDRVQIVYTPAIPKDHKIYNHLVDQGYRPVKRAFVLGQITENSVNISVAGTHGKTTTSCMLAAIFKASHLKFSAFLGGISADIKSNFYTQEGSGPGYSICEADEFDRSFLQLKPNYAIVTATDADHLDIYGSAEEIQRSFQSFADLVPDERNLLKSMHTDLDKGLTYGIDDTQVRFCAEVNSRTARGTSMDIHFNYHLLKDVFLGIPGDHNVENALAATIIALKCGVPEENIRKALENFKGIKRRFEFVFESKTQVYIDDYAHHPRELEAIISSARALYPDRTLTAVFQPHLYSRTRDFVDGFAKALSEVDELILLPIYPARELPIPSVESEMILERVSHNNKRVLQKSELMDYLKQKSPNLLLTLGAGDIDRFPAQIKRMYQG